jgi:hypothetical protein
LRPDQPNGNGAGIRRASHAQPKTLPLAGAIHRGRVASGLICISSALALAQTSADDANKSNNPLSLAASFNLQNYFTPSLFGSSAHTNDFLLRSAIPVAANTFIPAPEIFRVTLPVSTRPGLPGGYTTGLGDLNLFDIFLLHGARSKSAPAPSSPRPRQPTPRSARANGRRALRRAS